jgi:hypothetical protein
MARHFRVAFALLCLAAAGPVVLQAKTFQVGPVTLGVLETARIHVTNAEGGTVDVELVFKDSANNILLTTAATLGLGDVKTLDIKGAAAPGGIVSGYVVASNAVSPSTCEPTVTLQVLDVKNKSTNSSVLTPAAVVKQGLVEQEIAAIKGLRTLSRAQDLFFDAGQSRDGVRRYANSVEELEEAGLLPEGFGIPDYEVKFRVGLHTFELKAHPVYQRTGIRSFYVDETGILLGNDVGGGCQSPGTSTMPEI